MAVEWSNWSGSFQGPVAQVVTPEDLPALIASVRDVTKLGSLVHAEGSSWAFSAPAYCRGTIIDTAKLSGFPASVQAAVNGIEQPDRMLVAVEGGIKLRNLNDALYRRARVDGGPACTVLADYDYCLPSLGGAAGQSIAGAVNTGTHGGDVRRGPLSDAVRAIVMVGTGGQVSLLQPKAVPPIVDVARLTAGLQEQYGQAIPVRDLTGDDLFQAAVVSVGRFGVVWAYVLDVVNETKMAVVEERTKSTWSNVRRTLMSDATSAAGDDGYFGLVLNPNRDAGGDHSAYVTRHHLVIPGDPTNAVGQLPDMPWVIDARRNAMVQAVMQSLCGDRVTPALQALAAALRAAAGAIIAVGGVAAGPIGAGIAAEEAARPLFEGAESIERIGPDHLIGDAVADVLNLLSGSGHLEFVSDLLGGLLDMQETPFLGDGRTPWVVKGTRFEIADVFDLDHDCYRGDSVELFFEANATFPGIVDELLGVFTDMAAAGTVVGAAYFSIRFMAPGQALLTLGRWPMSASVEVALMRGLFGNFAAMRALQAVAVRHGGTVHWGQQNDLSQGQVEAAFGASLSTWRNALVAVEGDSMVFSTPFTEIRGLRVPGASWDSWVDLGATASASPSVADAFAGDPLSVFMRDENNLIAMRTRPLGSPDSDWLTVVNDDPVDGPPTTIRGHSGRIELFVRAGSRIRHTWQQDRPGGSFAGWDTLGSGDYSQVHDDEGEAQPVKHLDGRLEMFARGNRRNGMPLMHTWAHWVDRLWTDFKPRGLEPIISRPSPALRHVAGEQIVVVAMDQNGSPIEKHQTGPEDTSGWTNWTPLVPADPGAPFAVPPGGLSEPLIVPSPPGASGSVRVLVVDDRGKAFETIETGGDLTLTWSNWSPLPESPRALDCNTRMAFVNLTDALALFARSRQGDVYTIELHAAGWTAWQALGGDTFGELAAGTHDDGTLEVIARAGGLGHLKARRQSGGRW